MHGEQLSVYLEQQTTTRGAFKFYTTLSINSLLKLLCGLKFEFENRSMHETYLKAASELDFMKVCKLLNWLPSA